MLYDPTKPYKEAILEICRSTWSGHRVVMPDGSPYPVIRQLAGTYVHHTDGVGTKGLFYWEARKSGPLAQDAFAMNLNDLAQIGANPEIVTNHIIIQEEDRPFILNTITHLAHLCKAYGIALVGGETSIMDNVRGADLSVTMTGHLAQVRPRTFKEGDVLIGLASSGLHSNGFTKVRQALGEGIRPEFLIPTKLYFPDVIYAFDVTELAACHITGGAFSKLKSYLPDLDAIIMRDHPLDPQPIFHELYATGINDRDMYQTFNCGIGFILAVPQEHHAQVADIVGGHVIGKVVKGLGQVHIQSKFADTHVVL